MNKEGEIQKSNKISNMAKMLENQISGQSPKYIFINLNKINKNKIKKK